MQNKNNAALTTAIDNFINVAFSLLNKLDGDALTPAEHGARVLLQSDGVDFAAIRNGMNRWLEEIDTALHAASTPEAPAPTPTPEAPAPTPTPEAAALTVDAGTIAALVREQVAALVKAEFASLDLVKVAGEAAAAAFEAADLDYEGIITNNVALDDMARTAMDEAIDNNVDLDNLARDILVDKIDSDLNVDLDDEARDLLTEKINDNFDFDIDEAAQDIVQEKIDEDLDIERAAEKIIRDLLNNKPLTITLKG